MKEAQDLLSKLLEISHVSLEPGYHDYDKLSKSRMVVRKGQHNNDIQYAEEILQKL